MNANHVRKHLTVGCLLSIAAIAQIRATADPEPRLHQDPDVVVAMGSSSLRSNLRTSVLPVTDDSLVASGKSNDTFGAGRSLYVGYSDSDGLERSLLKFSLLGIPTDAVIEAAQVQLYRNFGYGNGAMTIVLYPVDCNWRQQDVKWNTCFGSDPLRGRLGEATIDYQGESVSEYRQQQDFTLNPAGVQALQNTLATIEKALSIALKWQDEKDERRFERTFCSSEGVSSQLATYCDGDASPPQLSVTYRLPNPPDTPIPIPTALQFELKIARIGAPNETPRWHQPLSVQLKLVGENGTPAPLKKVHVEVSASIANTPAAGPGTATPDARVCVGTIEECEAAASNPTPPVARTIVAELKSGTSVAPFGNQTIVAWKYAESPPAQTLTAPSAPTITSTPNPNGKTITPVPTETAVPPMETPLPTATFSPTISPSAMPTPSSTSIHTTSPATPGATISVTSSPTQTIEPTSTPISPKAEIKIYAHILHGVEPVKLTPQVKGTVSVQQAEWRNGKPITVDVRPATGWRLDDAADPWHSQNEYEADVVYAQMDADAHWTDWTPVPAAIVETRVIQVTATPGIPKPAFEFSYQADISPYNTGAYAYAFRMRRAPANGTPPSPWTYYSHTLGSGAINAPPTTLPRFLVVDEPRYIPTFYITPAHTPLPTNTSPSLPGVTPTSPVIPTPSWWLVRGEAGSSNVLLNDGQPFNRATRFERWSEKDLLQLKDIAGGSRRPYGLRAQFVMWRQSDPGDWALVMEAGWWRDPKSQVAVFLQRPGLRMQEGTYSATYRMKYDWDQLWTYVTRRDSKIPVITGGYDLSPDLRTKLSGANRFAEVVIKASATPRPDLLNNATWRSFVRQLPRGNTLPLVKSLSFASQEALAHVDEMQAEIETRSLPFLIEVSARAYQCVPDTLPDCLISDTNNYVALTTKTLAWWLPEGNPHPNAIYLPLLPRPLLPRDSTNP